METQKISVSTFLLCLFIFFQPVLAQDSAPELADSTITKLDEVVITGTRTYKEKGKIPSSISVVGRQAIESSHEPNVLPVLQNHVPGLFLNERTITGFGVGPTSGGAISMRGISGTPNTQVLVLIDGQPQFMGLFGHPIQDAYLSSDVERVEVIRGPGSILYGSNAMGGTINIITRKAKKQGFSGNVDVAYGSFNTGLYSATGRYNQGPLSVVASFNHNQTDGHRENADDEFFTTSGYLKVGYEISDNLSLTVDGSLSDSEFNDPGREGNTFQDHYYQYLRGRGAVSLDNDFGKVEGALRYFYNFGDHEFFDGWQSQDFNQGITFYQNLKLFEGNTITLGMDVKDFGGEAMNPNINLDREEDMQETDFYALLQHTFSNKFTVNAGYRFVNNSIYGNVHVPQFGMAYDFNESFTVKGSASKGFRSPTIVDFYIFPVANRDLQPEEMWNYELSALQQIGGGVVDLELTAFISEGSNLIVALPTGQPGPPQKVNAGEFSNKGIEFQGNWQASEQMRFSLNYSYLNLENPVPYAPEHQVNFQATYTQNKLTASASLRQVSNIYINLESGEQESYLLANAQASYQLQKWLNLYIKGENLLNTQYQIDQGYPMPGIMFVGGVRLGIQ